jgi:hypothetical protein
MPYSRAQGTWPSLHMTDCYWHQSFLAFISLCMWNKILLQTCRLYVCVCVLLEIEPRTYARQELHYLSHAISPFVFAFCFLSKALLTLSTLASNSQFFYLHLPNLWDNDVHRRARPLDPDPTCSFATEGLLSRVFLGHLSSLECPSVHQKLVDDFLVENQFLSTQRKASLPLCLGQHCFMSSHQRFLWSM